jgi:hypothetical protein
MQGELQIYSSSVWLFTSINQSIYVFRKFIFGDTISGYRTSHAASEQTEILLLISRPLC